MCSEHVERGRVGATDVMKHSLWLACLLAGTYALVSLQGIGTIRDCANLLYVTLDTGQPFGGSEGAVSAPWNASLLV